MSSRYAGLKPYIPGEQPKTEFIKLNTNENPYPPSPLALSYAAEAAKKLHLYPDPDYKALCAAFAKDIGVEPENVIPVNGSDEILDMAFDAFCGDKPTVFPDVTYGFSRVFAEKYGVDYSLIPVDGELRIDPEDYVGIGKNIFIANPNAPTGRVLALAELERIIASNPGNVVVIDEAYIDFGGESCVGLVTKYDNLLVTRTFSKSRSMAGARLGFGVASETLIGDLNRLRFSKNPYNLDSMTAAAGIGSLADREYFEKNLALVVAARESFEDFLENSGFGVIRSNANFVFAKHPSVPGKTLYEKLRENNILVRYFDPEKTRDYVRITVGTGEQMKILEKTLTSILEELK